MAVFALTPISRRLVQRVCLMDDIVTGRLETDCAGPDISDETIAAMRADGESFMRANAEDLKGIDLGQADHDFWLTPNGRGSGFWDRNLGEVGQRLAEAAETYGAIDLCVGDDG